jgi:hypothetical protein
MHEARSNSMNSSTFSCAESGAVSHSVGNVEKRVIALATWKSLKTMRPQS